MEKFKRRLSFRKKKDHVPECSKPHQWQEDERKVREGTCSFQVRYLGCIEVFESRGMQVCEEAVKALKAKKSRTVWARMSLRKKKKTNEQCKGKYQRAILYVSGDALRVVDEISKGLIVDQTIEKVSFCAPDRTHEKGFAYICRDGTTRRWMCHGFLALKESGERLSHAVGCAFAICLEKKQKREKDAVQVTYNDKGTTFERTGSFRQTTITERLTDPQSAILAEPVPVQRVELPYAVQRPHATDQMLIRQGSFRVFNKLNESSPFKRQLSLRLNELPSTLERQQQLQQTGASNGVANGASSGGLGIQGPASMAAAQGPVSPIPEASPTKEDGESISQMCQQLTQGLTALTGSGEDPFAGAPASGMARPQPQPPAAQHPQQTNYTVTAQGRNIPLPDPIRQPNPWSSDQPQPPQYPARKLSDAEFWLDSTATQLATQPNNPFAAPGPQPAGVARNFNGPPPPQQQQQQFQQVPQNMTAAQVLAQRAPQLAHIRSHSIDTAEISWQNQQGAQQGGGGGGSARNPSIRELQQRGAIPQFQSQQNGQVSAWGSSPQQQQAPPPPPARQVDPFEAAWSTTPTNKNNPNNPFQHQGASGDTVTKAFVVNL